MVKTCPQKCNFLQTCLRELAESEGKEERLGAFPVEVVVKDMNSQKVFQCSQCTTGRCDLESLESLDSCLAMLTFSGDA